MAFEGSCHCGNLSYSVDEELPTKAMACNWSLCRRRAPLHHFTTPDKFSFEGDEGDVLTYQWNTGNIRYAFCRTCGCAPFARGMGPKGPMVEINLRCVEAVDPDRLEITPFDGAHKIPGPAEREGAKAG